MLASGGVSTPRQLGRRATTAAAGRAPPSTAVQAARGGVLWCCAVSQERVWRVADGWSASEEWQRELCCVLDVASDTATNSAGLIIPGIIQSSSLVGSVSVLCPLLEHL